MQENEVKRKASQLDERQFEPNKCEVEKEIYSVDQKIKAVSREKDIMVSDSQDRVKLSYKKGELESQKKKHKKM